MRGMEALQSVQYVKVKDKKMAVLEMEDWENLVEWLENIEDLQMAKEAFIDLKKHGGDRKKAGWLKWDEIRDEL